MRTYTARSDGDALAVRVSEYDYLVLEPRNLGTSTVTVEARAADGTSAADTFAVEVLSACPPAPDPGARDYFPLEAVVRGSRDPALADASELDYMMAAEILLLI